MEISEFLTKVSLFSNLADRNIKRLSRACTVRTFAAGDHVVRQGEAGVGLFVITSGSVKVQKNTEDGRTIDIASHGAGEFIGEFSVLDGAARTANVVATEKTECIVLASWDFNSIVKAHPEIALAILPIVVKRFRETNEKLISLSD